MKTIAVRGRNTDDTAWIEHELKPGDPYYHLFNKPGVRRFTTDNGVIIERIF